MCTIDDLAAHGPEFYGFVPLSHVDGCEWAVVLGWQNPERVRHHFRISWDSVTYLLGEEDEALYRIKEPHDDDDEWVHFEMEGSGITKTFRAPALLDEQRMQPLLTYDEFCAAREGEGSLKKRVEKVVKGWESETAAVEGTEAERNKEVRVANEIGLLAKTWERLAWVCVGFIVYACVDRFPSTTLLFVLVVVKGTGGHDLLQRVKAERKENSVMQETNNLLKKEMTSLEQANGQLQQDNANLQARNDQLQHQLHLAKAAQESNSKKCCVCLDKDANRYHYPCGHSHLCQDCCNKVDGKCPLCCAGVATFLPLYS